MCVSLFQLLLAWMRSWMSHQFLTWFSVKAESCSTHELYFLLFFKVTCNAKLMSWMNCYVFWAPRHNWLYCHVSTALHSSLSVRRCLQSWVCVITGALSNSKALSADSLLFSQASLTLTLIHEKFVSRDSLGRQLTTKDVRSFSVCCMVSKLYDLKSPGFSSTLIELTTWTKRDLLCASLDIDGKW